MVSFMGIKNRRANHRRERNDSIDRIVSQGVDRSAAARNDPLQNRTFDEERGFLVSEMRIKRTQDFY